MATGELVVKVDADEVLGLIPELQAAMRLARAVDVHDLLAGTEGGAALAAVNREYREALRAWRRINSGDLA